ncbi:ergot alkaloid biosynthesis protein [Devosia beringensis]|uniref:ergot alkaloid biosynthesis protein n=1 Tax=Devosia beringensis TaxID=2657486 RepID=UPI00186BAC45|nr:ergot alkaloid biosynthesis protein [Devosia beringensis]
MSTILVTGATGKTGRRLVEQLQARALQPRLAMRSATSPHSVAFDWTDPRTHATALDGIGAVYLVAPPGVVDPLAIMRPFLELALERGVTRFVLLSASSLEEGGPLMGQVHAWLRQHAPSWLVLRPSWFMQNFSEQQHLPTILSDNAIYSATRDGRIGFIDAEDIAAVAVAGLTATDLASGDLVLTGPETLSYDEVARLLGKQTGRPVRHHRLTEAKLSDRFVSYGVPAAFAPSLAAMDTAIAGGVEDRITDSVLSMTGRRPASFADFVSCNAPVWTP